jgi:phosphoribosylformimino-5-aminoimidazole carboxamide ribotide isomerase
MILYPAIDLKDGQCVRLLHGDMDKATVFNTSPADQAQRFVQDGFSWLHVVDLNGAIEGKSVNTAAVETILESISIPVQLGGGIRTLEGVEAWIEAGVSRVILGTVAVHDPELVKKAARLWPEQIAVAKRDLAAAKLSAAVEKILADAPPLTDAQAQRIVALLLTGGGD